MRGAMSTERLLQNYPAIRTRSAEELQQWLKPVFAIRSVDMQDRGRAFDSVVNHCELPSLGLTYAHYGSLIRVRLSQNDFFVQGFPISGNGCVRWNHHTVAVETMGGGVVGGPGSEAELTYNDTFSHLILKFSPAVLTRKLSALIGHPIDPPLQLSESSSAHPDYAAGQLRLVKFLADELDQTDGPLPPIVLAEIEQAIIVSYLTATPHNYSLWLRDTPRAAAPWQVRRAVDYIEQNWNEPITIEALTHVTQTSARSLFHLFKRTHGVSPMVYVKRVRLRHARSMLTRPTPDTSVTSVGFLCGFGNMGHFARMYYEAFGERPSDTLKAHR
jgi:AraC-like DNA-binding protein